MTLQDWIRAERRAGRHWTQATVAARCGIHKVTLNKMLSGKVEARVGVMQQIAELTGGSVGLMDWPKRKSGA